MVELTYEELQILIQCVYNCNFNGKDVVSVGLVTKKLIDKLNEYESSKKGKQNDKK